MKLLVIGAQGQLGRSLVEVGTSQDPSVVALGRPDVDLLDSASIIRAIDRVKPHLVVNAAAYTLTDKAESEPELAHAINAEGASNVAEACAGRDTPLIHISTDYVFDGCTSVPYSEQSLAAPLNVYGHSKLQGERSVAAACAQHAILRTAWVYSPFGHNFVRTMLRLAESRSELNVVNDQIGNPTYAPHLAAAVLQIAGHMVEGGGHQFPWGIYHVTGTGEATWYQLAREVLERSASLGGPVTQIRAITTSQYPTKARRPADSRLDCAKCTSIFGVTLPDWRSGVVDCVVRLLAENKPNHHERGVNEPL
jgi:dTDP-4-dehydrorhamnose reductase